MDGQLQRLEIIVTSLPHYVFCSESEKKHYCLKWERIKLDLKKGACTKQFNTLRGGKRNKQTQI